MTTLLFCGCLAVGFSPLVGLLVLLVGADPLLLIVTLVGSLAYLYSITVAALWWYVVPPLRDQYWFAVPFGVLLVECGRISLFFLLRKFRRMMYGDKAELRPSDSIAVGVAYGLAQGCIMFVPIFWQGQGPGDLFVRGDSNVSFFIMMCMLFCPAVSWADVFEIAWFLFLFCWLHLAITTMIYYGLRDLSVGTRWAAVVAGVFCHLLASSMTLIYSFGGDVFVSLGVTAFVVFGACCYAIAVLVFDQNPPRVYAKPDADVDGDKVEAEGVPLTSGERSTGESSEPRQDEVEEERYEDQVEQDIVEVDPFHPMIVDVDSQEMSDVQRGASRELLELGSDSSVKEGAVASE